MTHQNDEGADAHASLLGMWGLQNPMIAWLIGSGNGEMAALRGEESLRSMTPPACPNWEHAGEPPLMLYRPGYWACYQHRKPVKLRHKFTETYIPDFTGSVVDALDEVVDLRYERNLAGRGQWQYTRRAL